MNFFDEIIILVEDKFIKTTILVKDKYIKTNYIGFIRKKERPGHEVASRNEFHVGVLVSLQGTIIEQNHVGQNPKKLRRKFCDI